ncbi:serine hydrolase domain-containing protein [Streptomyces gibsoniae]|uniref:Serine hydrolase domain-containing protein n=1 Tax=Streptomyces gibsoniae TaxID=3075529 RepID=A0ABU2TTP8_9ACTN|nr:serine hydrolase domain-containing protein [Streptomyces sp. DSM 41699]MDT0464323.1 serine hydrolase domain-containing protein [Streptomyces sp. DSM 41699]
MPTTPRRARWTTVAATTALLAAFAAGTAIPASAAVPPTTVPTPGVAPTPAAVPTPLPPLSPAALRKAIAGLPNANVTGALVRVTGSAGRWSGTSGTADLTTGRPVPADARFRIGSISKVFTAAVVLQLAAEHRLDLNGTVQQYLPGLLPADYPPVTVGELLNHTSGLPGGGGADFWGDGTNQWFVDHRLDSWTPRQVVEGLVAGQPMDFAPGSAQEYNGLNTFVAGLIVEQVSGRSFAQEVRDRIIRPLGLHATSVPAVDDPRLPGPHSHGYLTVTDASGTTRPADVTEQAAWPWAEGGMISSAADLDRFFTALFRGRLLPPAQQRLLFTVPDVPNHHNKNCELGPTAGHACFSMGLMRYVSEDGTEIWGKTGSRPGYTSGVFATRDLARRVVYSLNPTGLEGAEAPYVLGIVTATFTPGTQG